MSNSIQKPKIEIDDLTKEKLQSEFREEAQVIVHCRYVGNGPIRIWKSTYLFPKNSGVKCKLLHWENISLYPVWKNVYGGEINFTLIFSSLPKDCDVFDLIEVIPEPGEFAVRNIQRNKSDVYYVEFN